MLSMRIWPLFLLLLLAGCSRDVGEHTDSTSHDLSRDFFTYANTGQFLTRHLELDLSVDFDRQVLTGLAVHHMERLDPDAQEIVLDSRGLEIESVRLAPPGMQPIDLVFELGPLDSVKGQALKISLPPVVQTGKQFQLRIEYQTGAEASAIIYTLTESCRRLGANPHTYLCDVFQKLPHAATAEEFRRLTPKRWLETKN